MSFFIAASTEAVQGLGCILEHKISFWWIPFLVTLTGSERCKNVLLESLIL